MLTNEEVEKIVNFVKKEPRTIQDISIHIKRSWITTESYVKKIQAQTGRLYMKVFRPHTQGALKIVFIPTQDSLAYDDVKDDLFHQIKTSRKKEDFDFLEIFQFIKDSNKKIEILKEDAISKFLQKANEQVLLFSGNLSFINHAYKALEKLLKRKVNIRILCRVNLATLRNIKKIQFLIQKYPDQIEIRHRYHPLRGLVIDGKFARFRREEKVSDYRKGELDHDLIIAYETNDPEWASWLQNIFWNLYRTSVELNTRLKELKKIK